MAGVQVADQDVRILTGAEEGVFGWVQANYLLGRLGLPANQTLAVIDMGGGSMQARQRRAAAAGGANSSSAALRQLPGGTTTAAARRPAHPCPAAASAHTGVRVQETFAVTPEQVAERPLNSTEIVIGNGNDTLPDYQLYTHRCHRLAACACVSCKGRRGIVHGCGGMVVMPPCLRGKPPAPPPSLPHCTLPPPLPQLPGLWLQGRACRGAEGGHC